MYEPVGPEPEDEARPVVVMAHGLSGTRRDRLGAFAERFAEHGCFAFVFDHRGFGDSAGTPRAHRGGVLGVGRDRVAELGNRRHGHHLRADLDRESSGPDGRE
jgi:alpha-beta hydrolase superfamily lysophospholipase